LLGGHDESSTAEGSQTAQVTTEASTSPPISTAPETTAPVVEVDKTVSVTVLNSTQTSGLARKAVTALQGEGWTKSEFSYDAANARSTTAVYFAEEGEEATAQALVDDLGVGTVKQSSTVAADGIVVILGTDYVS
jgi:hypothetical protein